MTDQRPTPAGPHPAFGRRTAPPAVAVYERPARSAPSPAALLALLAVVVLMTAVAFLAFRFIF